MVSPSQQPNTRRLYFRVAQRNHPEKRKSDLKLQQRIHISIFLLLIISSLPSTAQIIFIPQRKLFLAHGSWTKWKHLPAECRWWSLLSAFMQGSDLDVFDVCLVQQMPARWQVGWNVLRSLAPRHPGVQKVRTVWSSSPGGQFQQTLPAAPRSCFLFEF